MSKAPTDNDPTGFYMKVDLRLHSIEGMKKVRVIDAFSGLGLVWSEVKKRHQGEIEILQIDQRKDKPGAYLRGDNLKFLSSIDLSGYDVIDLDAYGVPFKQLELIFKAGFSGIVHCTFIQSGMGMLPRKMLEQIGYPKAMTAKCPTLFCGNGIEKMCNYLSVNGINHIFLLSLNRKYYFYFKTC